MFERAIVRKAPSQLQFSTSLVSSVKLRSPTSYRKPTYLSSSIIGVRGIHSSISRSSSFKIATMAPTTRSQASTPAKPTSKPTVKRAASSKSLDSSSPQLVTHSKPTIAILGTGWAGFTLAQELGRNTSITQQYQILVLSPYRTMALTPLLASAACSIFDFRIAEEPVRRLNTAITKYQVNVESVNLEAKTVRCTPAIGSNGDARSAAEDGFDASGEGNAGGEGGEFDVQFDKLILAPGSETNTFGTPGVADHCYYMKTVEDAVKLRERMLDCFELATLPTVSEKQKRDLLHFIVIGAGPTGIELAAEIDELIADHLVYIYPEAAPFVTVSVYDVAPKPLGMFSEKLSEYATEKFKRRDVRMCMSAKIEKFERGTMRVKEDGQESAKDVGFGLAVWAAGNKACGLIEDLEVRKTEGGMERIVTDNFLHVLRPHPESSESEDSSDGKHDSKDEKEEETVDPQDVLKHIYALGDAADILNTSLPPTAETAVQKAEWLAKHIIAGEPDNGKPFQYKNKALVAYIGRGDGVISGKHEWTGTSAWLAWRSGTLEWSRSWRRRVLIVLVWMMNKIDGREVARR